MMPRAFGPWTLLLEPWLWALVVVAGLSGFGWLQTSRLASERAAHVQTKAAHAAALETLSTRAADAERANRAEEARRFNRAVEIADEAVQEFARAQRDADAAAAAGRCLRAHTARLLAACGGRSAEDSAPAGPGAAASSTADLLAYVQRRLDAAAEGIARHADASRTAGLACERIGDSLRGGK
jgi:Tfp pilus assembly protein PilV